MPARLIPTILLYAASSSVARADATAEARRAIQSRYDRINATVLKRDIKGLKAFYTTDYVFVGQRGDKHGLSELQAGLERVLPRTTEVHGKTVVESIRLTGNTAVARVR